MIEQPPPDSTLSQAAEWFVRLLNEESIDFLVAGKSALGFLGEPVRSVDLDFLVLATPRDVGYALEPYVARGDLHLVGAVPGGAVVGYLVGRTRVDILDAESISLRLFDTLRTDGSADLVMGTAGTVRAVNNEGYFVLAVMAGLRGFAKEKRDPMRKVRDAWRLIGPRTNREKIDALLAKLGKPGALARALQPPL